MTSQRIKNTRRFAQLPVMVLQSRAVITLPHAAFRVLVLLAAEYNGHNNGALGLTCNQARVAGIGSDQTLYRAFRDLQMRALIKQTYPASRVPPRPTMWALTWLPLNDTKYSNATRKPNHAYLDWQHKGKAA